MFRIIGVLSVVAAVALGVAHFTGHVNLSGDAEVTEKGSALLDQGVEETQKLTNRGLEGLQGLTNKGFDAMRNEEALEPVKKK